MSETRPGAEKRRAITSLVSSSWIFSMQIEQALLKIHDLVGVREIAWQTGIGPFQLARRPCPGRRFRG